MRLVLIATVCGSALTVTAGPVSRAEAAARPIMLGYYTPPANVPHALTQVGAPAILNSFWPWKQGFPKPFLQEAASMKAVPLLTWEPYNTTLSAIASGRDDYYVKSWARAAHGAGRMMIRFAHEMNGSWYPWGVGVSGNTPAQYVAAWRHVVNLFRAAGDYNVHWIWCIGTSAPQTTIGALFPGANYVDWMAMDGYNRDRLGRWRSLTTIFGPDYRILARLDPRLRIMVAETASVENPKKPRQKSAWIKAGFLTAIPTYFPRIRAVLYFDSDGAGYDFPWTSSRYAKTAVQAIFKSPLYRT